MIFVTVGTHEQQFNRLIKEVDRLKGEGLIQDDVFIQTGFSDYEPVHCQWKALISYDEMNRYIDEADIVITHGGPATFMGSLIKGKKTIVVPRLKEFGEHVNNHQLEFVVKVKKIYETLEIIVEIGDLEDTIIDFLMIENSEFKFISNNENFNYRLNAIIKKCYREV